VPGDNPGWGRTKPSGTRREGSGREGAILPKKLWEGFKGRKKITLEMGQGVATGVGHNFQLKAAKKRKKDSYTWPEPSLHFMREDLAPVTAHCFFLGFLNK